MSTEGTDPLDELERPKLADQIEPYREYGDTDLALALLHFQKREAVSVPALKNPSDLALFEANSQPANVGFDYYCESCEENVRGVSRPNGEVLQCPLCGEGPGMLTLGRGPK